MSDKLYCSALTLLSGQCHNNTAKPAIGYANFWFCYRHAEWADNYDGRIRIRYHGGVLMLSYMANYALNNKPVNLMDFSC